MKTFPEASPSPQVKPKILNLEVHGSSLQDQTKKIGNLLSTLALIVPLLLSLLRYDDIDCGCWYS